MLTERRAGDMEKYARCRAYAGNSQGISPTTCLFHPNSLRPSSRRVMRRLLDARAEMETYGPIARGRGNQLVVFQDLEQYADYLIDEVECTGGNGSDASLHGLKGLRSLLFQEEAVHAVSWLWGLVPGINTKTEIFSTTPIRWKRTTQPRVLSAALTKVE